jgi:hypothetical protein
METAVEIFKILMTEGLGGVWSYIKDMLGNLTEMVMSGIREWVATKVIMAGITWILSLLNPASAFVRACKMIIDVVLFFIERGSQIISLVNAVLDSIAAVASGALGAMASAIEGALAKAVPVAISFLASLLGLGGISDVIRRNIEKIQEPVNKAIDWLIAKAVKLAKAIGGLFGGKKKEEEPETPATADPEHDAKIEAGLVAIDAAEQPLLSAGRITQEEAEGVATTVKRDHPVFSSLTVVDAGERWDYVYTASASQNKTGPPKELTLPKLDGLDYQRILDGELLDVTGFMNPQGVQLAIRPDYKPPEDALLRTNAERCAAGLAPYIGLGVKVVLHHSGQDFFGALDEQSATFHSSVGKDPEFHPFTTDPGYLSWRGEMAWYGGGLKTLGDVYDLIRPRYWRARF